MDATKIEIIGRPIDPLPYEFPFYAGGRFSPSDITDFLNSTIGGRTINFYFPLLNSYPDVEFSFTLTNTPSMSDAGDALNYFLGTHVNNCRAYWDDTEKYFAVYSNEDYPSVSIATVTLNLNAADDPYRISANNISFVYSFYQTTFESWICSQITYGAFKNGYIYFPQNGEIIRASIHTQLGEPGIYPVNTFEDLAVHLNESIALCGGLANPIVVTYDRPNSRFLMTTSTTGSNSVVNEYSLISDFGLNSSIFKPVNIFSLIGIDSGYSFLESSNYFTAKENALRISPGTNFIAPFGGDGPMVVGGVLSSIDETHARLVGGMLSDSRKTQILGLPYFFLQFGWVNTINPTNSPMFITYSNDTPPNINYTSSILITLTPAPSSMQDVIDIINANLTIQSYNITFSYDAENSRVIVDSDITGVTSNISYITDINNQSEDYNLLSLDRVQATSITPHGGTDEAWILYWVNNSWKYHPITFTGVYSPSLAIKFNNSIVSSPGTISSIITYTTLNQLATQITNAIGNGVVTCEWSASDQRFGITFNVKDIDNTITFPTDQVHFLPIAWACRLTPDRGALITYGGMPVSFTGTIPNQTGTLGSADSVDFSSYFMGASLIFAASGLPTGVSINSSTGVVSGIYSGEGSFSVVITAFNIDSYASSNSFSWEITNVDQILSNSVADTINSALRLIGVLAEGEVPSADTSNDCLLAFNEMVESWSIERLSVYATQEQIFLWPPNEITRTLGPTGDFIGQRPILLDDATYYKDVQSGVSYGIKMINDDQYNGIAVKNVTSTYPQVLWVNMQYPNISMSIYPKPTKELEWHFVSVQPLSLPGTLSTILHFPPGYLRAFRFNLACELAPEFGVAPSDEVKRIAMVSKRSLKRINNPDDIAGMPYSIIATRQKYNIFAGNY